MEVITVTEETFEKEVINSKTPVLIDFNADWCGPCKMIAPILDEVAKANDNVKIVSINVDDNDELARKYNVFSIPCLVLIKDGEEKNRSVGMIPKEEIEKLIGE